MNAARALALSACAAAALAAAPALPALFPTETWDGPVPATFPASARAHADALCADDLHGQAFRATRLAGPPDAARVVFVLPQFHRSPVLPILWSSLGEAIAGTQGNLDVLVTRLVRAHGVRCLGSEGSWADPVGRPDELQALASAAGELQHASQEAGRVLPTVHDDAARLAALLTPFLRRQALTLDGVGIALWRLPTGQVHHFGIEEQALNARALALLARMRPMEEELARLEPASQGAVEDQMALLWRDEFPAFRDNVLTPLRASLAAVESARKQALAEEVELEAAALGRLVRVTQLLLEDPLRADDVERYDAYYRDVGSTPANPPKPRKLSAAQKKRAATLHRRVDALQAEYERIAGTEREAAAARRVLARLPDRGTCALVMGANHEDGLVDALRRDAPGTAVIVVEPYVLDEQTPPHSPCPPHDGGVAP